MLSKTISCKNKEIRIPHLRMNEWLSSYMNNYNENKKEHCS